MGWLVALAVLTMGCVNSGIGNARSTADDATRLEVLKQIPQLNMDVEGATAGMLIYVLGSCCGPGSTPTKVDRVWKYDDPTAVPNMIPMLKSLLADGWRVWRTLCSNGQIFLNLSKGLNGSFLGSVFLSSSPPAVGRPTAELQIGVSAPVGAGQQTSETAAGANLVDLDTNGCDPVVLQTIAPFTGLPISGPPAS